MKKKKLLKKQHVRAFFPSLRPRRLVPPLLPSAQPIKCKKIVPSTRCRWNCSWEPRRPRRPRLPWNTKAGGETSSRRCAGRRLLTHTAATAAAAAAAEQHQAVTLLEMCV